VGTKAKAAGIDRRARRAPRVRRFIKRVAPQGVPGPCRAATNGGKARSTLRRAANGFERCAGLSGRATSDERTRAPRAHRSLIEGGAAPCLWPCGCGARGPGRPSVVAPGTRNAPRTHLLKGGAGVRQVQELLGHGSLATTQLYTRVGVEDLREVLMRAHPRERSRRGRAGR
jgi:hypothetical protein